MNNFIYQNPVKILFGKNQIENIAAEIPEGAKILLTYGGGSIFKNGVYDQCKAATKGMDIIEFGGIEPNPKYETLMKAVEICKLENIDYLLSVGGGSVLDGTKFIAAAVKFEGDDCWDILRGAKVKGALPIGCVMTLPATGSEMNAGAVVSKLATKEKMAFNSPYVMPKFSVLDPSCIASLPDRQVANGIVDSFVHVIEQYLTYPVNSPIQDRFAEGILNTLVENGPRVLDNKADYDSAANYMWCATLALNGLISAGVPQDWTTHHVGHELTALHNIDHAKTLAVVLPAVLKYKREEKRDKILQYGERVWNITEGSDEKRIDDTIAATVGFFEKMGIKTKLADYDVADDSIDIIVSRFKDRNQYLGEHKDIDFNAVRDILAMC